MTVAEILRKLGAEAPADCLLIGGFALAEYGTARATYDIDIAIRRADAALFDKFLPFLSYRKIAETEIAARFRHAHEIPDLDLLYLRSDEFDRLWSGRENGASGLQVIGRNDWADLAFESCHAVFQASAGVPDLGMQDWLAKYAATFRLGFDPVAYVHFREECPLPTQR